MVEIIYQNENKETPFSRFVEPLRDTLQAAVDSGGLDLPEGVSLRILLRPGTIHVGLVDAEDGDQPHGSLWMRRRSGQWRDSPLKLLIQGDGHDIPRRNYGWPEPGKPLSPKAIARVIELCGDTARGIARARRDATNLTTRLSALRAWGKSMPPTYIVDLKPFSEAANAHHRRRYDQDCQDEDAQVAPEVPLVNELSIGFWTGTTYTTVVSEEGHGYIATLMKTIHSLGHRVLVNVECAKLGTDARPIYDLSLCHRFSDPEQVSIVPRLHDALVRHYEAVRAAEETGRAIGEMFRP